MHSEIKLGDLLREMLAMIGSASRLATRLKVSERTLRTWLGKSEDELHSLHEDNIEQIIQTAGEFGVNPESRLPYRIYFAWRESESRHQNERTIVFSPTSDEWNDFARRTQFKYSVSRPGNKVSRFSGEVHLAFLESADTPVTDIRDLLKGSSDLASRDLPGFYTMHSNLVAYRNLVLKLGFKETMEFLLAINDLVAVKQNKLPKWFASATTSKDFTLSFMRSSETFFAFHNAGYVLRGTEHKVDSGISKALKLKFKLPSFENAHELDFTFEHEGKISKRIAVVIGKNGVGKSQTLSNLARSLISGDERLQTTSGDRPSVNRLITISSPGQTSVTFPRSSTRNRIPYRKIQLGGSGGIQTGFGETLVQLARSAERVRNEERWELFCDAISKVIKLDQIFIQLRPEGDLLSPSSSTVPLSRFRSGSEKDRLELWGRVDPKAEIGRYVDRQMLPLSSGELTFIRFAAQACLFIENGTLLLFDEPETHLHPNLITQFVGLLDELLKMTSSFAVLATHSAYFVREVPSSQVLILKELDDGGIQVVPPRLKTLGADIGAISFFVFGDELYGRLLHALQQRLRRSSKDRDVLLKPLEDELSDEAFMYLRRELYKGPSD